MTTLPLNPLRDASWINAARMRGYVRLLGGLALVLGLGWIGLSQDGLDMTGKPLGTDFLSFWAASKLALGGHPAAAYDVARHGAIEAATFPGTDIGYYAFFYPPLFLLICLPLALLPYGAALAAWLAVTGSAFVRVVIAYGGRDGRSLLPILAFPAVFTTIGHGQNAFLSAALFGGALVALPRRPALAGLLFGLLAFKPHLGLLVPVFLLASGAWAAAIVATLTVLAFGVLTLLAFGPATWAAFLAAAPLARASLEQGLVGPEKMTSVFAALQLWGAPVGVGYAMQAVVALAATVVLVRLVRARPACPAGGPALVAASLLASPFLLDYDLALLAIPLAFVFERGRRLGFWPYEKAVLLAAYVLPLVCRSAACVALVPLAPPVVAALFAVVVRRGYAEAAGSAAPAFKPAWRSPASATR